jgi:hypothetical protein
MIWTPVYSASHVLNITQPQIAIIFSSTESHWQCLLHHIWNVWLNFTENWIMHDNWWITTENRFVYVTQVHTAKCPSKVSEHKTKENFTRRKPHTAVLSLWWSKLDVKWRKMLNLWILSGDATVYDQSIFFSEMVFPAKSLHLFHPGIHCPRFANHKNLKCTEFPNLGGLQQ